MKLIKYLNENFYTRQELLELTAINDSLLDLYQNKLVMPKASYSLAITLRCDSFIAKHQEQESLEFYAKGYINWLKILSSTENYETVFTIFSKRYTDATNKLAAQGLNTITKCRIEFEAHIKSEWQYFINGTYGLCTKSGAPEEIAAKELAIFNITRLTALPSLNRVDRAKLIQAVELLDESSATFAPHELPTSSRQKFVNDIREQYQLNHN